MQQHLKQLMMTLALLLTATTGAWATDPDLENDYTLVKSVTWGDGTNIAGSGACAYTAYDTGKQSQQSLTILTAPEAAAGWIAMQTWTDGSGKGWWNCSDNSLYCVNAGRPACVFGDDLTTGWLVVFECKNSASSAMTLTKANSEPDGTFTYVASEDGKKYFCTITAAQNASVGFCGIKNVQGITKISVYKPNAAASSASAVEVTWNETDKAWEFEMPEEGDVELEIAYKTVSAMTVTFDGEAIPAEGVTAYLGHESAFVSALAAAVTGVDDATFTVESSDATVIAFGESNAATGALADVKFLKEGQATLTVTFAGNDDYGRASQTIAVTVTEMTYDVTLKEGTQDADKWTVKAGTDGSFQSLPLEGVKAGTKVKLKYDGDRSMLKGVKATSDAKPAATVKTITIAADFHTSGQIATAPEITIEYNEGEKWSDVAARYDWLKMYETYTVYYDADSKSGDLHTADGGVKPSDLVDPNKSYYWGFE